MIIYIYIPRKKWRLSATNNQTYSSKEWVFHLKKTCQACPTPAPMGKLVRSLWNPWQGCGNAGEIQASVPPCFQGAVLQVLLAPATKHITPPAQAIFNWGAKKIMEHPRIFNCGLWMNPWIGGTGEAMLWNEPSHEPSHHLGAWDDHRWGQFRRRRPIATTRRSPWSISSHCFIDGWICMLVSCIHMLYISPFCTHTYILNAYLSI